MSPDQMNSNSSQPRGLSILISVFLLVSFNLGRSTDGSAPEPTTNSGEYFQDWREFSFPTGGFRILFPKVPDESSGTLNVGRTIVRRHTFSVRADILYTVMYFDVPHADEPKANGNLLVGFRDFAIAELKAELISDNPISIDNNAGRLLEVSVPKRGMAKALILVTEARLYKITVVPEKSGISETDFKAASTRFLESFKLLDIDRSAEGEVESYLRGNPELAQRAIETDSPQGLLNGKALSLPLPEFPSIARGVRASGTVVVRIIIDEAGKVIAAQAVGGHPLLQTAAEEAARKARFSPTLDQGKPIKVLGKVQYNFVSR
jgi:TonB family protein